MSSYEDLGINPTGCPGPIPGTKVWRCDGTSCVYGERQYASCKDEIKRRGYELRITSDLIDEVRQDADLRSTSAVTQLEKEQKERAIERRELQTRLRDTEITLGAEIDLRDNYINLQNGDRIALLNQLHFCRDDIVALETERSSLEQQLVTVTSKLDELVTEYEKLESSSGEVINEKTSDDVLPGQIDYPSEE